MQPRTKRIKCSALCHSRMSRFSFRRPLNATGRTGLGGKQWADGTGGWNHGLFSSISLSLPYRRRRRCRYHRRRRHRRHAFGEGDDTCAVFSLDSGVAKAEIRMTKRKKQREQNENGRSKMKTTRDKHWPTSKKAWVGGWEWGIYFRGGREEFCGSHRPQLKESEQESKRYRV